MAEATIERLLPTQRLAWPAAWRGRARLHCHLGSTLKSVQPVLDAARQILPLALRLRALGHPVDTLDMGGGLGIDYSHRSTAPVPPRRRIDRRSAAAARRSGPAPVVEPGRSIVGAAARSLGASWASSDTAKAATAERAAAIAASCAPMPRWRS